MARKDCMIPQTVPKRPMNGQAEAVVARNVIWAVRRETSIPIARSRARSTPEMFLITSLPAAWIEIVVAGDSSGRAALIWASSSAYPALNSVVRGESASWPAIVLTSEKRLDLRKKATNLSDWREIRARRMYFAKMMIQEMLSLIHISEPT